MPDSAPDLTLFLGGVRAGKSAAALAVATSLASPLGTLFVATAQATDEEMKRRIAAHRRERPPTWETIESPVELATDLERHLQVNRGRFGVVVIDCITLWVSNVLLSLPNTQTSEAIVVDRVTALLQTMGRHTHVEGSGSRSPRRWIVVSNEVGLGVIAPTTIGRQFEDALGRANQRLAAAARDVKLMVAGLSLPLKVR